MFGLIVAVASDSSEEDDISLVCIVDTDGISGSVVI